MPEPRETHAAIDARRDAQRGGGVLAEIGAEMIRSTAKHGDQNHLPNGTGPRLVLRSLPVVVGYDDRITRVRADDLEAWARDRTDAASFSHGDGTVSWEQVLTEEWAEAIATHDPAALRKELIQVAAVAAKWVQALDVALPDPATDTGGEGQ